MAGKSNAKRIDAERENSPLAIVSLVLGILSILAIFATGFSLLFSIGAIVLGFMGYSQIRRENMSGRSYATWGISLGFIGIVLFVIFILVIGAIGLALFRRI